MPCLVCEEGGEGGAGLGQQGEKALGQQRDVGERVPVSAGQACVWACWGGEKEKEAVGKASIQSRGDMHE